MKQPIYVFTNLAISFDGKITTSLREHIDPSRDDRNLMDFHRCRAEALLVGANTLRAFQRPSVVASPINKLTRKLRGMRPNPVNIILATKLDFDPSWPFFKSKEVDRILAVPKNTTSSALSPFKNSCDFIYFDPSANVPAQVVTELNKRGIRNLLIEGGGGVLFPWVEADLIDEWNVTVCPRVIGGESAPTMVEGVGFDAAHIRQYRLKKCRKSGDEVFLQYKRRERIEHS